MQPRPAAAVLTPDVDRPSVARRLAAPVGRSRGVRRGGPVYFLFLVPALVLVCGLMVYPIYSSFALSLHQASTFTPAVAKYVGFQNYTQAFHNPLFGDLVRHTYLRAIGGVVPSYLLGVAAALILHQRVRLNSLWRVFMLLPFVLSGPVAYNSWLLVYNPQFGLPATFGWHITNPLTDTHLVWPVLLFINAWGSFQFYTILLLAGLQRIPTELYEAASMDGAGAWRRFRHITVPGIAALSLVACALHFMASFQDFNLVYLTTGGGPLNETQTLATYAYTSAFGGGHDIGTSTAVTFLSAVIMILTMVVLLAGYFVGRLLYRANERRLISRRQAARVAAADDHESSSQLIHSVRRAPVPAAARRSDARRRIDFVPWLPRIGTFLFVAFVMFPLLLELAQSFDGPKSGSSAAIFWPRNPTLSNYSTVLGNSALYQASNSPIPPLALNFLNSVLVTAGVTILCLVAGLLGGYSLARWRGKFTVGVTGLMLTVQLIPAIMLVFPLYLLLVNIGLLNTRSGQVLTTAALTLPFSVVFFRVYFMGNNRALEEAAAVDGAGAFRTFVSIVIPNSRPAIGAMAAFTIITSWNEFLIATTVVSDSSLRTFPPSLQTFMGGFLFQGSTTPGVRAVYLVIPTIIAALLLAGTMRQLMSAYQGGSVKN